MSFTLPQLDYAYDALEPHIDSRTMEIHHSKHHQGYTNKLNAAIEGTNQESKNINVAGTIQEPVYSIIRGINNFKLLNRSRDFLRKGYIEEFYMIR